MEHERANFDRGNKRKLAHLRNIGLSVAGNKATVDPLHMARLVGVGDNAFDVFLWKLAKAGFIIRVPVANSTKLNVEILRTLPVEWSSEEPHRKKIAVAPSGPPTHITTERLNDIRGIRDALTFAIWLHDHPQRCERQHTDDLNAEELFTLAYEKAKR